MLPSRNPRFESVSPACQGCGSSFSRLRRLTGFSIHRLDVLKVRLQTSRIPPSRIGAGSRSASAPAVPPLTTYPSSIKPPLPSPSVPFQRPGLASLWKTEGSKFLFAGAAAPIIGLAFIDSAFFGGYGFAMYVDALSDRDEVLITRFHTIGKRWSKIGRTLVCSPASSWPEQSQELPARYSRLL